MSDTNCPYCGEPEETDTPSCITIYRCGTRIYPNGSSETPLICDLGRDLRREREAHNQTKRERDEARHKLEICMAANSDVARIARERDEARDMVEKLTNQGLELMDENRSLKREYKKTKNEIEGWKNKWECAVEMAAVAENESEEQARLLGMSAERDESLRGKLFMLERELARIKEAAKEVVKVWETPPWKMGETPSNAITKLRDAIRYED